MRFGARIKNAIEWLKKPDFLWRLGARLSRNKRTRYREIARRIQEVNKQLAAIPVDDEPLARLRFPYDQSDYLRYHMPIQSLVFQYVRADSDKDRGDIEARITRYLKPLEDLLNFIQISNGIGSDPKKFQEFLVKFSQEHRAACLALMQLILMFDQIDHDSKKRAGKSHNAFALAPFPGEIPLSNFISKLNSKKYGLAIAVRSAIDHLAEEANGDKKIPDFEDQLKILKIDYLPVVDNNPTSKKLDGANAITTVPTPDATVLHEFKSVHDHLAALDFFIRKVQERCAENASMSYQYKTDGSITVGCCGSKPHSSYEIDQARLLADVRAILLPLRMLSNEVKENPQVINALFLETLKKISKRFNDLFKKISDSDFFEGKNIELTKIYTIYAAFVADILLQHYGSDDISQEAMCKLAESFGFPSPPGFVTKFLGNLKLDVFAVTLVVWIGYLWFGRDDQMPTAITQLGGTDGPLAAILGLGAHDDGGFTILARALQNGFDYARVSRVLSYMLGTILAGSAFVLGYEQRLLTDRVAVLENPDRLLFHLSILGDERRKTEISTKLSEQVQSIIDRLVSDLKSAKKEWNTLKANAMKSGAVTTQQQFIIDYIATKKLHAFKAQLRGLKANKVMGEAAEAQIQKELPEAVKFMAAVIAQNLEFSGLNTNNTRRCSGSLFWARVRSCTRKMTRPPDLRGEDEEMVPLVPSNNRV